MRVYSDGDKPGGTETGGKHFKRRVHFRVMQPAME